MRSSRTRSTVGFRSSILREMSVRQDSPNQMMPNHGIDDRHTTVRISSGDIRASPRFLGYLFCTISGSVLLVSVVQFYLTETSSLIIQPLDEVPSRLLIEGQNTTEPIVDDKFYVTVSGDLIYRWKLWGAIYTSASIVGICLIVMVVHYDTVIAPRLWMAVFRDGSLAERNLIFFLTICWMAGLHICTSSLSVGEVQANVYFTSWISFGSIALTYGVWRESAGLPTLMDIMNQHHRETTYNWIWIMIFSTVFAGAATDIYVNREELEFRYQGELLDLRRKNWITVLSVLWADVLVSGLAILFNEWFLESKPLPCSWKRKAGTYRCVFGWRQLEGIVMALGVAAKFWVIYEYTGVDGVINGLSNGYFGIWGTFFNSVFALGTWLKENKNTEYVILEPNNDDDQS
mmetsp:Transcript_35311/g.73512  ORF Transcript_35311/g.73512 Transcript_35311/m.73512 type:complete len:403 (-) Transcript_35311:401-1609(-)